MRCTCAHRRVCVNVSGPRPGNMVHAAEELFGKFDVPWQTGGQFSLRLDVSDMGQAVLTKIIKTVDCYNHVQSNLLNVEEIIYSVDCLNIRCVAVTSSNDEHSMCHISGGANLISLWQLPSPSMVVGDQ